MTDELAIIPRDQLETALARTTTNLRIGGALMIAGSAAVIAGAVGYAAVGSLGLTATVVSGGLAVAVHGYLKLIRALRIKAWLGDQLRAQELPPTRLLRG